jgi:hypothetical protein
MLSRRRQTKNADTSYLLLMRQAIANRADSVNKALSAYDGESLFQLLRSSYDHAAVPAAQAAGNFAGGAGGSTRDADMRALRCTYDTAPDTAEEDLALWLAASPSLMIPTKIVVNVYIVTMHHAYNPLGKFEGDRNGFDYGTLMAQISRLKLANQDFTISMQSIDASKEGALGLGLASCMREKVFQAGDLNLEGDSFRTVSRRYLNAQCALAHIQHYDEEHLDANKMGPSSSSSSSSTSSQSNKFNAKHVQHLVSRSPFLVRTIWVPFSPCDVNTRMYS